MRRRLLFLILLLVTYPFWAQAFFSKEIFEFSSGVVMEIDGRTIPSDEFEILDNNDTLQTLPLVPDTVRNILNVNKAVDHAADLGIGDKLADEIRIHPNPATDRIFIDINEAVVMLQVYNLTGGIVKSERGTASDNSVDLSGLKHGMYLLVIKTDKKVYTQKIIKR
jgi:hypothetical protein